MAPMFYNFSKKSIWDLFPDPTRPSGGYDTLDQGAFAASDYKAFIKFTWQLCQQDIFQTQFHIVSEGFIPYHPKRRLGCQTPEFWKILHTGRV